jgi:hypothetical protein
MNIWRSVFWVTLVSVFCAPVARVQIVFPDPFYKIGKQYISPSRLEPNDEFYINIYHNSCTYINSTENGESPLQISQIDNTITVTATGFVTLIDFCYDNNSDELKYVTELIPIGHYPIGSYAVDLVWNCLGTGCPGSGVHSYDLGTMPLVVADWPPITAPTLSPVVLGGLLVGLMGVGLWRLRKGGRD